MDLFSKHSRSCALNASGVFMETQCVIVQLKSLTVIETRVDGRVYLQAVANTKTLTCNIVLGGSDELQQKAENL